MLTFSSTQLSNPSSAVTCHPSITPHALPQQKNATNVKTLDQNKRYLCFQFERLHKQRPTLLPAKFHLANFGSVATTHREGLHNIDAPHYWAFPPPFAVLQKRGFISVSSLLEWNLDIGRYIGWGGGASLNFEPAKKTLFLSSGLGFEVRPRVWNVGIDEKSDSW